MNAGQSAPRQQPAEFPPVGRAGSATPPMATRTLRAFFAWSFGLTWGLGAVGVLFAEQLEPVFGEPGFTHPLFLIAMYAPALAALFLVGRHGGLEGLGRFLRRLTLVRMPGAWWAFLVVGIPAIVYLGAALSGTISDAFPFSPWYAVLPAAAFALALGPVEELGWRGLALPLLQPLRATVGGCAARGDLGAVARPGVHVQRDTAVVLVVRPLLHRHGRGLDHPHAPVQRREGIDPDRRAVPLPDHEPAFPDARPWDTLVWVAAAALVVLGNRRSRLSRGEAVTEVLLPRAGRSSEGDRSTSGVTS